jgi:hypothetical protein
MRTRAGWLLPTTLLLLGCVLTGLLYLPGLQGPWLLDDHNNLRPFLIQSGGIAPYHEIIFSNPSGPLGRPVSMASFVANHAAGLFSTPALKATNLVLHLFNGLMIFLLLRRLFALRAPATTFATDTLAAMLAIWWCLLPLHLSTVLYIVQRMTEIGAFFSLASCLAYVQGRTALATQPLRGGIMLACSFLLLLPLALLAKESSVCTLAWLILIELFFFQSRPLRPRLGLLLLGTALLLVLVLLWPPATFAKGYLVRDFTMGERLLSQPRAIWSYIHAIFLPEAAGQLGIFHDDFPVSRQLLQPWTTLPALAGLLALLLTAWRLADSPRWWPAALGLLLYFSGHLAESTVAPLEIYFEHRNYLPSLGLLLAVACTTLTAWRWQPRALAALFGGYLALLSLSTAQRSHIWGNEAMLLEVSARSHPHSLRANDVYVENLLGRGETEAALASSAQFAHDNPEYALPSLLHMVSIYCRIDQPVPPSLIHSAVNSPPFTVSTPEILSLNLSTILKYRHRDSCRHADFSALNPVLLEWDGRAFRQFGLHGAYSGQQRLSLMKWLAANGARPQALALLQDLWRRHDRQANPETGILLAVLLRDQGNVAAMRQTVAELVAVTASSPAPVRHAVSTLQQQAAGLPAP